MPKKVAMTKDEVEIPMPVENPVARKKARVLKKDLVTEPGCLIITVLDGKVGPTTYDPKTLPQAIQDKLPATALNHKLGDAASGKKGEVAENAIAAVWQGMMNGNWTTRLPAQPKVNVADVKANFERLTEDEQKIAREALKNLGLGLNF